MRSGPRMREGWGAREGEGVGVGGTLPGAGWKLACFARSEGR